jgi:WD40 repeat protein
MRYTCLFLISLLLAVYSLGVVFAQAETFSLEECNSLVSDFEHGFVDKILWSENDIIVSSHTGIWLYDSQNLHITPRLLTRNYSGSMMAAIPGLLVTTSEIDYSLRFWDVETATEIRMTNIFEFIPTAVAIAPNGQIAAEADMGYIHVINGDTGMMLYSFENPQARAVNTVMAFSSDGRLLAAGGYDSKVRMWDVETGEQVVEMSVFKPVSSIAFSPDGMFLAAGLGDPYGNYLGPNTIHIWRVADIQSNEIQEWQIYRGHAGSITGLSFSPDSHLLVSASRDGSVRLWDMAENNLRVVLRDVQVDFMGVAFSPDSTQLATGDGEGNLCVRDI